MHESVMRKYIRRLRSELESIGVDVPRDISHEEIEYLWAGHKKAGHFDKDKSSFSKGYWMEDETIPSFLR